jgi:hypothetical protein
MSPNLHNCYLSHFGLRPISASVPTTVCPISNLVHLSSVRIQRGASWLVNSSECRIPESVPVDGWLFPPSTETDRKYKIAY